MSLPQGVNLQEIQRAFLSERKELIQLIALASKGSTPTQSPRAGLSMAAGASIGGSTSGTTPGTGPLPSGLDLIWMGEWDEAGAYAERHLVRRDGSVYIAACANTGQDPLETEGYWELFAAKGDPGPGFLLAFQEDPELLFIAPTHDLLVDVDGMALQEVSRTPVPLCTMDLSLLEE